MAGRPMSTGGFLVIALGLALLLIAAGATVFAVIASASASTAITLTGFGVTISASPLDLFIAGAVSVVLLGLGFALISRGTRRSARAHKELRALRKDKAIAATTAATEPGDGNDSTAKNARGGGDDDAPPLVNKHLTGNDTEPPSEPDKTH
jgi:membrane protein implicated in regulation of membrane protease activity